MTTNSGLIVVTIKNIEINIKEYSCRRNVPFGNQTLPYFSNSMNSWVGIHIMAVNICAK